MNEARDRHKEECAGKQSTASEIGHEAAENQ